MAMRESNYQAHVFPAEEPVLTAITINGCKIRLAFARHLELCIALKSSAAGIVEAQQSSASISVSSNNCTSVKHVVNFHVRV